MVKQMDNRVKVGLIFVILILVAILATIWVFIHLKTQFPGFQERMMPLNSLPGDLEFFYAGYTILSSINIALLIVLTLIYVDVYLKTHSPFSLGLVIFALAFLMKDLTSNPFIISLFRFRAFGLGPFEFLPGLFEFFALSILLYLSVRY
jgi:hypothetical protein